MDPFYNAFKEKHLLIIFILMIARLSVGRVRESKALVLSLVLYFDGEVHRLKCGLKLLDTEKPPLK